MSWILRVREKFQAAHFLKDYRGKCENIHGHTFKVEVKIKTSKIDKTGITIDFMEIKKRVNEILPDHALLNEIYDFNPSAENLSRHFYFQLKKYFPVVEVTVWESEDAAATYSEDI